MQSETRDISTSPVRDDAAPLKIPLIARLEAMCLRTQRLLIVNGFAVLVLCAPATLIALMVLDWLFWFPGALRLVFALGWLALLSWIIARYIWPPLSSGFSWLHLANKIEERFGAFQDRLTSAVSFITEDYTISGQLEQKLIERTERIAQDLPIESVITTRPVWRSGAAAVVSLLVAVLLSIWNPAWFQTGSQRYLFPFLPVEWPKSVNIEPLTENLTIARGESVVVAMHLTKGQSESIRGFLNTRRDSGATERLVMRREGAERYALNLTSVTENMTYWFEAGDDTTRNEPGHIRVVMRPRITQLRIAVHPPAYAPNAPKTFVPSGQRSIEIINGSALHIRFKSSKPAEEQGARLSSAWIVAEGQDKIICRRESEGHFSATIRPSQEQQYDVRVIDTDGFENETEERITVTVREDAPPVVRILKPIEILQVTPAASVQIVGVARDDLGIRGIELSSRVRGAENTSIEAIAGWTEQPDEPTGARSNVDYRWRLEELNLSIGDTVEYTLLAWDNRSTEELEPQMGRSHTLLLKVVSEAQLRTAITDELSALARKLRQFLSRQITMHEQADALREQVAMEPRFDAEAATLQLSSGQRQLAEQVAAVRRELNELSEKLSSNDIGTGPEKHQVDLFSDELAGAVEPGMREAASILNSSRGAINNLHRAAAIGKAEELQTAVIQALEALLDQLTTWDDYNTVVQNLREMGDLQQRISQETAVLQQETLGLTVEELSAGLRERVERSAQEQDRVTEALERALSELRKLEDALRDTEPENAGHLRKIRNQLEQQNLAEISRRAAEEIRENQTGQAQADQNRIERALADAVSQLEMKQSRKLAELSKKLARVEEVVRYLLEQQQLVHSDTEQVDGTDLEAELPNLAVRQRNLSNSCMELLEPLKEIEDGRPAEQIVRLAAERMNAAVDDLYGSRREAALADQEIAIERLRQALQLLEELREKNEQAIRRQQLFATRRLLLQVRKRQLGINDETAMIIERVFAAGRLTRIEVRRARQQAGKQNDLRTELAQAEEHLAETPVYLYVVKKIGEAMGTSAQQLLDKELDRRLHNVQQRIIILVDQLIEALAQAEAMADEQFAEGGGAGAGPSRNAPTKPVPTIAELIVLKGMQQDIHRRTSDLQQRFDEQGVSEPLLEEARELGEEQQELRKMTDELTQKARARHNNM